MFLYPPAGIVRRLEIRVTRLSEIVACALNIDSGYSASDLLALRWRVARVARITYAFYGGGNVTVLNSKVEVKDSFNS